jgi:hypothetical protein
MKTSKPIRGQHRTIGHTIAFLILLIFSISQCTIVAQSSVLLSTPAGGEVAGFSQYNWGLDIHYDSAVEFTTPASQYFVSRVDLYLNGYAPNNGISGHISFYNKDSGTWLEENYYGPNNSGSVGYGTWITFVPTNGSESLLLPNTTYLMNVTADQGGFNWIGSAHPPGLVPSGLAQYEAFYVYGMVFYPRQDSYVVPSFAIYSTPVPEPNTLFLFGFAIFYYSLRCCRVSPSRTRMKTVFER